MQIADPTFYEVERTHFPFHHSFSTFLVDHQGCVFAIIEGKLLGHVVSKKGISIDPERIKAIEQIPLPHNKKGMQSFMGTINFVRRFVPDFAQMVKPLQQMVKQSVQFKWTDV